MKKVIPIFLFTLLLHPLQAQEYKKYQYRAEDGLQTDMVKSISQDESGCIWIGTDEGIIQYDGNSFISHEEATGSNYIKHVLLTQCGRMLAIHDMGITEIWNKGDSLKFVPLFEGANTLTDTALWYPKSAFEDSRGNIWIAEPQSIVRIGENLDRWKRYPFEASDNSSSFVRSFSFMEFEEGQLLISSFPGNYFIYHYADDRIEPLPFRGESGDVYTLQNMGGRFLAGTNVGLYELLMEDGRLSYGPCILDVLVTDLAPIDSTSYFVCSENASNYIVTRSGEMDIPRELSSPNLNTNRVFISPSGNIWLSTQKGIALLVKPIFMPVQLDEPTMYVEAICSHPDNPHIYMLGKEAVWEIDKESGLSKRILDNPGAYFLSGAATSGGIWLSNSFEILHYQDGEILYRRDLSAYGRFVFNLYLDDSARLWIGQEAAPGVKVLDTRSMKLEVFGPEWGLQSQVTAMTENDSAVFLSTSDPGAYLYYQKKGSDRIVNLSHHVPWSSEGFRTEGIAVLDEAIWLATSQGLLKHRSDSLVIAKLNSISGISYVRALRADGKYLWFGNSLGLFRYDTQSEEINFYNEDTGLPTNFINQEGILFSEGKLWVGTPFGMSVMEYRKEDLAQTQKPLLLQMRINGRPSSIHGTHTEIPFKAYLEFDFSALSFPSNEIQYSYRIPQQGSHWSTPDFERTYIISGLKKGHYQLEAKAKKVGNHQWSEAMVLDFFVMNSFVRSWKFFLMISLLVLAFVLATRILTRQLMQKRQRLLEKLVEERTSELDKHRIHLEKLVHERTMELANSNTALQDRNDELNDTIEHLKETQYQLIQVEKMASLGVLTAGVAHEINNPLNFINGGYQGLRDFLEKTKFGKERQVEVYLNSIREGVDRATHIVQGLNQFSRDNEAMDEVCDIHEILENCLTILLNQLKHRVTVTTEYSEENRVIKGNVGKLHQVFINLITNAIQSIEDKGSIHIETKRSGRNCRISITDSGCGIPEENLKKITDPFFTTKDPNKGTGLGLYITASIVSEHRGRLNFHSKQGKGTTATVRLPVS